MRRRAYLTLGSGLISGLAGCNEVSVFGGSQEQQPQARTTTVRPVDRTSTPYEADDDAANIGTARGIAVLNRLESDRYVTVVVRDGNETVAVRSGTVPAGGDRRFGSLVRKRGIYRVLIETADGRQVQSGWVVHEGWVSPLRLRITSEGIIPRQQHSCEDPTCPPLGVGTRATALQTSGGGTGRIQLRNVNTSSVRPTLTVTAEDGSTFDSEYQIPPGIELTLPIVDGRGTFGLEVSEGEKDRTGRWHVPEEFTVPVEFRETGPAICPDAPTRATFNSIRNNDGVGHAIEVRIRLDGETVLVDQRRLGIRSVVRLGTPIPTTGRLQVAVGIETGAVAAGTWELCAPRALRAEITPDASVRLFESGRVVATDT